MNKLGFIGAGNMATAIIKGILKSSFYKSQDINIFDVDEKKIEKMKELKLNCFQSSRELVKKSGIIILAIKPQVYDVVLSDIKESVTKDKIFVSIAAGISIEYINSKLGKLCPIVRVMPNTPLLLGKGATAICCSENVDKKVFKNIFEIFAKSGEVYKIKEDQMNNIIPVNGSSPAYIYLFAKVIQDFAINKGIDAEVAMNLICKTLEGSAEMLRSSGYTPNELITMVCSKGGTTIEAIDSLKNDNFSEILNVALEKCANRAYELSN